MFEVEAKVWIKEEKNWEKLHQEIKRKALFVREELKEDVYFAEAGTNKPLFRLRDYDGQKLEVTIKDKEIEGGIEKSKEESFQINDKEAFLFFCQKIGYHIFIQKQKKSLIYTQNGFTIELNTIVGLGDFLEIEKICKNEAEAKNTQTKLQSLLAEYGFNPRDFESRPYYQLLLSTDFKQTTHL